MKMTRLRQGGFTLVELTTVIAILGLIAYFAAPQISTNARVDRVNTVEGDIEAMKQAYNAFYTDFRRAPVDLAELVDEEYYQGQTVSPFNTDYQLIPEANGASFQVVSPNSTILNLLDDRISSSDIVGTNTIQVTTPEPLLSTIASQFLHKVEVDGQPELNQMETNIDANGNNIINVATLIADNLESTTITTEEATIEVLNTVDTLEFGENSIETVGGELIFNATTVTIAGDLAMTGEITGNGGDLTGFDSISGETGQFTTSVTTDTLQAEDGVFVDVEATTLTVDTLNGEEATFQSGDITNLTFTDAAGDTLVLETLESTNVEAVNLAATTGQFGTLSVDDLTADAAEIVSLTATSASVNSLEVTDSASISEASITALSAGALTTDNLTVTNGVISSAEITTLTADEADFVDLSVGTLIADEAIFEEGEFSELESDSIDAVSITADDIVAATGTFVDIEAAQMDLGELIANSGVFSDLTVSGTISAGEVSADNATFGTLNGDSLSLSGTASFETISANSATITGDITTDDFVARNGEFTGTLSADSFSGSSASFSGDVTADDITASDEVTASSFSGTTYSGTNFNLTGDASTDQSSINTNRDLIDEIISNWEECQDDGGCQ